MRLSGGLLPIDAALHDSNEGIVNRDREKISHARPDLCVPRRRCYRKSGTEYHVKEGHHAGRGKEDDEHRHPGDRYPRHCCRLRLKILSGLEDMIADARYPVL